MVTAIRHERNEPLSNWLVLHVHLLDAERAGS
jgi:hypothetical protein